MHSYYESPQPDDVQFDKVGFHVPTMVSIHKQISMHDITQYFLYDIPGI